MNVSWAKLDSGGWGVRVHRDLNNTRNLAGETVTVRKRDGSTAQVKLGARVMQANGGRTQWYHADREEKQPRPSKLFDPVADNMADVALALAGTDVSGLDDAALEALAHAITEERLIRAARQEA